ncbi:porin [Halorhodospira sp. 9621]|uniref:porin n=1 Tax=Halorhodospira sp. 9621 TaxID=2899135 RepID=UPI001EE81079|nr:porin [Halorhodospira sp. 9621]MCG5533527.1 porin [Halorhodospira sp. 9621]
MKKQLITLATATAMAAPVAVLADSHDDGMGWFDLYGQVHTSLDNEGYDNVDGDSGSLTLHDHSSRIGIRGEKGLDTGVEAFYQLEQAIHWHDFQSLQEDILDADRGLRDTFVGLRDEQLGELRYGRLPWLNNVVYGPGNFFPLQAGDPGNVISAAVNPVAGDGFPANPGRAGFTEYETDEANPDNAVNDTQDAVQYTTPDLGAFGASLTVHPSHINDAGDQEHNFMAIGTYNEGPLSVQATFFQWHYTADDDMSALVGSAEYDFGGMRIGGGGLAASNDADDQDNNAVWLGGDMDVTNRGTVKAQLAQHLADASDSDTLMMAVGYDFQLAEQTKLYANLVWFDNDDQANVAPHSYATSATTTDVGLGEDGTVTSFGVHHHF